MIRHQFYRVCHDCVGDLEVPDPQQVELVAINMCGCFPSQGGYKLGYGQQGVHLTELAIQVSSYDDLRSCILLDDVLSQVNHRLSPFNDKAFLPGVQVHIQDVHLLPS